MDSSPIVSRPSCVTKGRSLPQPQFASLYKIKPKMPRGVAVGSPVASIPESPISLVVGQSLHVRSLACEGQHGVQGCG